jgi:hypothetical protein
VSKSVTLQLKNVIFKNPGNAPAPVCVDYQKAARQLAPLIELLASGDELTRQELATIVIDGWRVVQVAENLFQRAGASDTLAQAV